MYILVLLTLVAPAIHVIDPVRLLIPGVMAFLMAFAVYCPRRVPHWLQMTTLAVGLAGLVMALGIASGFGPGLVLILAAVAVLAMVAAGHDHQIMAMIVVSAVPTLLAIPALTLDVHVQLPRVVVWSLLVWPVAVMVLDARSWRLLGPLLGLILIAVALRQPASFAMHLDEHGSGRLVWAEAVIGLYAAVVIWPSLCRANSAGARTVAAGVATALAVLFLGWATGPWVDGWPVALSAVAIIAMTLTIAGLIALLATIPYGRVSVVLAGRVAALVGVATTMRLLSGIDWVDIIGPLITGVGAVVTLLITGLIAGGTDDERSDLALVRRRPLTVAVTSGAHTLLQTIQTRSLQSLRTIRVHVLRWHHLPATLLLAATYHAWPHLGRAWWGVMATILLMLFQTPLKARPESGVVVLVVATVVVALGLGAAPWPAMMFGSLAVLVWCPYVRWPSAGSAWAMPSMLAIMALAWPWLPVPIQAWPAVVLGAGISGLSVHLLVAGQARLPVLAAIALAVLLFLWRWVPLRDPSAPYVMVEDGITPILSMILIRLPLVLLALYAIRIWSDDRPLSRIDTTRSVSTILHAVERGSLRWVMVLAPVLFLLSWPLVLPAGLVAWIIVGLWSSRLTALESSPGIHKPVIAALAWMLAAMVIGTGRSLEVVRASAGVGLRAGILGEIMLLCLADVLSVLLSLGVLVGLRPWWQTTGQWVAAGRRFFIRHEVEKAPAHADSVTT